MRWCSLHWDTGHLSDMQVVLSYSNATYPERAETNKMSNRVSGKSLRMHLQGLVFPQGAEEVWAETDEDTLTLSCAHTCSVHSWVTANKCRAAAGTKTPTARMQR